MSYQQYNRQKTFYRWSLFLCIVALTGYSVYFLYERIISHFPLFTENKSLYLRITLIVYFSILLIFIDKLPQKIFNRLGFLIAVPLGWMVSVISFLTIGFEGITVTGYIFLIMSSAIVFDFSVRSFSLALILIMTFHFTLLSFYPTKQFTDILNHIFLFGLSGILGLTSNYLFNIIKNSEAKVLQEREILLREIHHRVKNNLQVISSLLNLQIGTITDSSSKLVLAESQSRVKSMALIHQLLYESERFSTIDFGKYLRQLMVSIHGSFSFPRKTIEYKIVADNIFIHIDTAVPLGLITNELVTNAYKYAFPEQQKGLISLEITASTNNSYTMVISDNGKGLPATFDLEQTETLGLKLVRLLVNQIDGKIEILNTDGAIFKINFLNK